MRGLIVKFTIIVLLFKTASWRQRDVGYNCLPLSKACFNYLFVLFLIINALKKTRELSVVILDGVFLFFCLFWPHIKTRYELPVIYIYIYITGSSYLVLMWGQNKQKNKNTPSRITTESSRVFFKALIIKNKTKR